MLELFSDFQIKLILLKLSMEILRSLILKKEHDTANNDSYILGDFNTNLYLYGKYIIYKNIC